MKAILKFNLPEEDKEYLRTVKSLDMALALWDIRGYLRQKHKYGEDNIEVYEEMHSKFYSILSDYDINLDTLLE